MTTTEHLLPALDLLTVQELQVLRQAFLREGLEARKKANKVLVKTPSLSMLWTQSLSSTLSPEDKATVDGSLHLALLKQPAAFIQYNHANTMVRLAHCVWQEILRRSL